MPRMIRSWVTSSATMSSVSTVRPSRMIVVVSAISAISLSLWEIMIDVMPCALSWRRRPSRCSESLSFSAAVGSSRMRSLTSLDSALAISTSCCLPTPSWPTGVTGSSSRPTRASSAAACELARFQSMSPRCAALVAEEDVLRDREEGHQRELLVDDHDALGLGVVDRPELDLVALEEDRAVVGAVRVHTREHLHEGRLAGTVLAADRVDLATLDRHRHVLQCLDAGEGLGDGLHLKNGVGHAATALRRTGHRRRALSLMGATRPPGRRLREGARRSDGRSGRTGQAWPLATWSAVQ